MAFCFSDSFGMFDVTPVENLFLEEYMPRAPGDYVKVYLYGLKSCYHPGAQTAEAFARSLGVEESLVSDAFAYWEKQGVVRRVADRPPTYQYNNLKAMLLKGASPEDEQLYRLREFNIALQGIFGARLLSPNEYTRAAEWIDELALSEDAVLMMVRSAVNERGAKVTFAYLDKMAASWAKGGLSTKEAAEEYLRTKQSAYVGARKALKAMGQSRAPTVAEERLYQKWAEEWGFSYDAVERALEEMTKIASPNFAYLDKVLDGARGRGATDAAAMRREQSVREETSAPVREVLAALGLSGGVTDDLRAMYKGFMDKGFDADAVLTAARNVRRGGGRSMRDVADALDRFAKRGLYSGADIAAYLERLSKERDDALALKALTGDEGGVTAADINGYRRMMAAGLPMEVLRFAAELAAGAKEPLAFAAKIAENWKAAGIVSIEAARREHEARGEAKPSAKGGRGKEVSAQKFKQREYNEDEWSALAMDIDALGGDK